MLALTDQRQQCCSLMLLYLHKAWETTPSLWVPCQPAQRVQPTAGRQKQLLSCHGAAERRYLLHVCRRLLWTAPLQQYQTNWLPAVMGQHNTLIRTFQSRD
jgi:hypothetical protein